MMARVGSRKASRRVRVGEITIRAEHCESPTAFPIRRTCHSKLLEQGVYMSMTRMLSAPKLALACLLFLPTSGGLSCDRRSAGLGAACFCDACD